MGLDIKSVLVVDGVGSNCAEILQLHDVYVTMKPKITKAELLEEIPKYDALVVRSATQVTKEILEAGTNLKVVARAGAGVDNIDVAAAGERGVGVINAPGANALSACELTCNLILSLARHVVPAAASLKAGRWDRTLYTGTELSGKTLAVIGLGRVGREVSIRMHAFGMTIIGYDPFVTSKESRQFHVTKMELEDIWHLADYITLHTPLIESTKNLIDANVLKKCKSGVKIINVGRGGLINERDLFDALNAKQCELCSNIFTDGAQCSLCEKHLDFTCAKMTEAGWKKLGAERRSNWKCPSCRALSPSRKPEKEQVTLENIMKELTVIKQQLSGISALSNDIQIIKDDLVVLKASSQFTSEKIDELESNTKNVERRLVSLESKCINLETNFADLNLQMSINEKRSRLNNVEIKGVPLKKDENLFKIVDKIGTEVNFVIPKTQINYISRVPSHNIKDKPIIISFLNRYVKEDFIAASRALKTLKAEDLGFTGASQRVYVNDHLTADSKVLLNKTREAAKHSNYSYVWVKFGKIHVRKNETSRTIIINKQQDLNKIT